jgi:transposase-like protein
MNRYSSKDRKRALALHKRKWGYRRIAQVFGCAESTVKKWVERADHVKNPKPDHHPRKRKAAVEFYKNNEDASISGTAKKYGVHAKTMARWLKAAKVSVHSRPRKYSRDAIVKDIEKGLSGAEIARKHECSESYVSALRNNRV